MKCPSCGAEVTGAVCSYCGSEMPRQPINITNNYYGPINNAAQQPQTPNYVNTVMGPACSRCGGTKISYERESTVNRGLHKTVAICKTCGNTWVTSRDVQVSSKNKIVALILCIFMGFFGVHQFYVGKSKMGWIYLFTVGLFGIGWIVDIVRLATGTFCDVNGIPLR